MKIAAYIRVSTTGQARADAFGLDVQRDAIQRYADRERHEIAAWYQDIGISGATIDRPGLTTILQDAEAGMFGAMVVARMDRVARDVFVQLWIEKELLKAGVEVISATEPLRGRDPMMTAFRQMTAVFAELEKSIILQRMKAGRKMKASRGGFAGGRAPIGYRAQRGSGVLTVDPEKSVTVRRVFEIKKAKPRATLQVIADTLNAEGHRTAQGKLFARVHVKRILDRKGVYLGECRYDGKRVEGKHEAILKPNAAITKYPPVVISL